MRSLQAAENREFEKRFERGGGQAVGKDAKLKVLKDTFQHTTIPKDFLEYLRRQYILNRDDTVNIPSEPSPITIPQSVGDYLQVHRFSLLNPTPSPATLTSLFQLDRRIGR
jgi:hypothetical protein